MKAMPGPSSVPAVIKVVVGHRTATANSTNHPKMSAVYTSSPGLSASPTPDQITALQERTNSIMLEIVRNNMHTQLATQAASLAAFRDALSAHGSPQIDDATFVATFRSHVPLSNYDVYKPFIDKFDTRPCKVQDVMDLLVPGLPLYLAPSSATSGTMPKLWPKYDHSAKLKRRAGPLLNPDSPLAALFCTCNREIKEIEGESGEVIHRVPMCIVTGAMMRRPLGWLIDDENNMSLPVPGYAVPWAATNFAAPFVTLFLDMIRYIDQRWDELVSCIRDGTLPDLEGIGHVQEYLKAHLHPDPARAAELLDIGPPSSCEGWVARVWPGARMFNAVCSGPFATVVPKVRSILGPNVTIRTAGYRSSETTIGLAHHENTLDEWMLSSPDLIEFLDVSRDETHEQLSQPWEVEVDKQYEPILTTWDGLWRYHLGDVVSIIGFDAKSGVPVFKYSGRRSMTIRLPHALITDDQLLAAVQTLASGTEEEGALRVHEFTTVMDDRAVPPTVGFFVELAGPLGPHADRAPQRLFDAFVSTNAEHVRALAIGQMRRPTIRILEQGTFAAYRPWKGDRIGVPAGQIKVPMVAVQPEVQTWILERVVKEL